MKMQAGYWEKNIHKTCTKQRTYIQNKKNNNNTYTRTIIKQNNNGHKFEHTLERKSYING